jgi:hypothetical protein
VSAQICAISGVAKACTENILFLAYLVLVGVNRPRFCCLGVRCKVHLHRILQQRSRADHGKEEGNGTKEGEEGRGRFPAIFGYPVHHVSK